MLVDDLFESRSNFSVGDPVIITGDVQFRGKTGDVREVGRDGAFVVVDLYNYGPRSFHSTDVSYNDYADSDDEAEYQQGVAEGSADKTVKVVKRRGKPIGEIGIDPEASPGNGSYYVKLYDGSVDLSGFDTAEEALAELKYLVKQSVAETDQVGNMPADRFDSAMARLKQLAGADPLKTVWDPQKRVYKNVPTAVQPKN